MNGERRWIRADAVRADMADLWELVVLRSQTLHRATNERTILVNICLLDLRLLVAKF